MDSFALHRYPSSYNSPHLSSPPLNFLPLFIPTHLSHPSLAQTPTYRYHSYPPSFLSPLYPFSIFVTPPSLLQPYTLHRSSLALTTFQHPHHHPPITHTIIHVPIPSSTHPHVNVISPVPHSPTLSHTHMQLSFVGSTLLPYLYFFYIFRQITCFQAFAMIHC